MQLDNTPPGHRRDHHPSNQHIHAQPSTHQRSNANTFPKGEAWNKGQGSHGTRGYSIKRAAAFFLGPGDVMRDGRLYQAALDAFGTRWHVEFLGPPLQAGGR